MRVTTTLDNEIVSLLDQYAVANDVSRAKAAALIVSSRLRPRRVKYVDGWPVLDLPKRGHPLTTEMVKEMEEEW